jgi:hydroxyacyl-ACP dehydratase HTD2-like protein with hotdog domain
MIERHHIGLTTAPSRVRVDPWRVKLFCQAIGETDPVFHDEASARAAGLRACTVPPTFLKALESDHCSSAALLGQLKAPLERVLHAEQTFTYRSPVFVGDDVEISRRISDIHDKRGGALTFIVVETRYLVRGEEAASSVQTILIRGALGGAS